jgi:hypothetical protein
VANAIGRRPLRWQTPCGGNDPRRFYDSRRRAKVFRFHQLTGIKPPFAFDPAKPPASDKATVLKLLGPSFDYVIERLPKITPEQLDRTLADSLWEGRQR